MRRYIVRLGLIFWLLSLIVPLMAQPTIPDDEMLAVIWSPDGTMLAHAYSDGNLQIWSNDNQLLFDLKGAKGIDSIAWSPDSKRIAVGSWDGIVYVWNITSSQVSEPVAMLTGHLNPVLDVAWNVDGTQLVSVSQIGEHTIRIWDMTTYKLKGEYHWGGLLAAAWHPVLDIPAIGSEVSGAFLIDPVTSTREKLVKQPIIDNDLTVASIAWSPNTTRVAIGDGLATIHILDGTTYTEILTLKGHILSNPEEPWTYSSIITALAWHPDNRLLASASPDQTVRVWDTETGEMLAVYQNGKQRFTTGLSWSRYGGRLVFPALPSSYEANVREYGSKAVTALADGAIQLVVPVPSLDRLIYIAPLCLTDIDAPVGEVLDLLSAEAMAALTIDQLPDFVTKVETLPPDAIPPACAADLIAVANAILAH